MYKKKKFFIISNQGLHPIHIKLQNQFCKPNEVIKYENVTLGSVELNEKFASIVAKKTHEIIFNNLERSHYDFILVWSGMPIYNLVIYNVIKQTLKKDPKVLIWDKFAERYITLNVEARYLIFEKK